MLKLKVSLKGLDKGKELSINQLKRVLMKSMFKMEELAIENAPHDQNTLREKIHVLPEILSDKYLLTSGASHSEPMEYGTKPFYAPITPLKEWARRKLGNEGAAYAVQKKIAKDGITAHPFMRPAYYEVLNFWVDIFVREELSK